MVRRKGQPTKKPRRVALMPASNSLSSPLLSSVMPGVNTYKSAVDNLAAQYGVGDEDPLDTPAPKKKPTRRRKKAYTSPEFVITKRDEALIKEGARLQQRYRRKLKRSKKTTKRVGGRSNKSVCFDKRTTLQSLLRKIPDAKKPLSQWLK